MNTIEICEPDRMENLECNAIDHDLELCRQALTHDRARPVGRDTAPIRKLQILVVGNEQHSTAPFVRLVRRWGHAVRSACNRLDAMRAATEQQPDVVLLNVERPLLDGYQLAQRLRSAVASKNCLIVAFAGKADDQRRRQGLQAGIDLLLVKPVDPAVIETLLMLECVLVNRKSSDNAIADTRRRYVDQVEMA